MKKIAISIPVHEQPLVIENQLQNIYKFVPNSVVVLHASADSPAFFHQELNNILKKFNGFAYLNPAHYHTHSSFDAGNVTGLSTVHASNFNFIDSQVKFDIFAIDTSNDMFVRPGIMEHVFEKYDCCFHVSMTKPEDYPFKSILEHIKQYIPVKTCEKNSQEGSAYPREVFKAVSDIILKMGGLIKAEEMYLPTLAFNLFPELYNKNSGCHYVYHNPAHSAVTKDDIHKTQYSEYGLKFVVKRVPRRIDDPIRQYINEITKI